MTQLGQMYEKEKIEYGNRKAREKAIEMAKSLMNEGEDLIKIMKVTGLTEDELLRLQDEAVTVQSTAKVRGSFLMSCIQQSGTV